MRYPGNIEVPRNALHSFVREIASAINFITKKDSLDSDDIQAIEKLLLVCKWCEDLSTQNEQAYLKPSREYCTSTTELTQQ